MAVRYEEQPSLRLTKVTLSVYAALLLAVFVPPALSSELRAGDLVLAPVLFLPFLPVAVLPLSKRRYSAVRVTDEHLIVGRSRLPLAGLTVTEPAPGAPLLGGAYGAPLGWRLVGLLGADGRPWAVATKRPGELVQVLQARAQ